MNTTSTYKRTQKPSLGFLPWIIWGLGTAFYCYEFLLQVSTSVMVNELMLAFNVKAAQLGNLSAFYLYAYTLMQIPVGILLDQFGSRRLLTIACSLCAIGAIVFGTAQTFHMAAAGRFLIGIGSAFALVSSMHLAATWFPIRRFALLAGLVLTFGMLGAFCGEAPLSLLISHIGWRQTMVMFGMIGAILAIAIYSVIRDNPNNTLGVSKVNKEFSFANFFSGIKIILKNKQSWIASVYGGLMFLPTPAFASLWGVPFLVAFYNIDKTKSAFIVSLIFIGWAVGSPLFGWFSDRIALRKPPMITGTIGALICITCVIYLHMPLTFVALLLFGFGFFCGGFLPAFSIVRELNPPSVNATAIGFANTLNSIGGAMAQPVIGILLDWRWSGQFTNGIRVFSINDYHTALAALPICILLALCIIPFIKETYCKQIGTD